MYRLTLLYWLYGLLLLLLLLLAHEIISPFETMVKMWINQWWKWMDGFVFIHSTEHLKGTSPVIRLSPPQFVFIFLFFLFGFEQLKNLQWNMNTRAAIIRPLRSQFIDSSKYIFDAIARMSVLRSIEFIMLKLWIVWSCRPSAHSLDHQFDSLIEWMVWNIFNRLTTMCQPHSNQRQ